MAPVIAWDTKPFEDCLEKLTYTRKVQTKDFLQSGEFPVISQEAGVVNGYWNDPDDVFQVTCPIIAFGDHTRSIKYVDFDFVLGADGVKLLKPKTFLNPRYFWYYLQSLTLRSIGYARHYRLLRAFHVRHPTSLKEQERIVAILDEAFEGIRAAIKSVEMNLQSSFELFNCLRESLMSPSNKPLLTRRLDDVVHETCTLSYGIIQPGLEQAGGLPIVRPTDLTSKIITLYGLKRIDPELAEAYRKTKLKGNELLLCVRGATGAISIASPELANANVTRGIVPICFDQTLICQRFGYYLMNGVEVQDQIRAKTYGAALMQINIRDLRGIHLSFPSIAEQKIIVGILESLSADISNLAFVFQQKRKMLKELEQSLLHAAFSGKL